jgi:hypothetical protein
MRARTGRALGALGLLLLVLAIGCKNKPPAIAELAKADGPVERQQGQGAWTGANVGQKYYLGDAARTADGGAELALAGSAVIEMEKYTVLRFGAGKDNSAQIAVALGAVELRGTGSYGLDVGEIKLADNGAVRVTSKGPGKSSIELLVGSAQIASADGQTLDLEIGKVLDLDLTIGPIKLAPVDAGVEVAAADAAIDAGAVASTEGSIEVTGRRAEILPPGAKRWQPLPAGAGQLVRGAKVRLGAGTTAKLVANGVTLAMAGGSRTAIGDDLKLDLELGVATASVETASKGAVGVPGGGVAIEGSDSGPG